jgi:uncharacterized membrane protein
MPVIDTSSVFASGALLLGLAWLGFWIDTHEIGRRTSGVVWILVTAMLLSNTGVIALESPAYDFVGASLVPVAIPLLLLKADLKKIFTESGWVMLSFLIASAGTLLGAVVGFFVFDLGDMGAKVAGTYAGSWIGGAVNFVAVSQAVAMTPQEFSESLGAGAGVSIIALLLLVTIPSLRLFTRWLARGGAHAVTAAAAPDASAPATLRLTHLAGALAISFAICAVSEGLSQALNLADYNILLITLLTIVVANLFAGPLAQLKGDFELGMLIMYLFFAAVGAGTDAVAFLASASVLFFYGLTIILLHLVFVLGTARALRIDPREAIVASAAALVGPAPTAAIAATRGWHHLVTPGIMCGIFGYVIGTFLGVSLTELLLRFTAGAP